MDTSNIQNHDCTRSSPEKTNCLNNQIIASLNTTSSKLGTVQIASGLCKDAHAKNITLDDWNTLVELHENSHGAVDELFKALAELAKILSTDYQVCVPLEPAYSNSAASKYYVDDQVDDAFEQVKSSIGAVPEGSTIVDEINGLSNRLTEEVERATQADAANATNISNISKDYLKSTDKQDMYDKIDKTSSDLKNADEQLRSDISSNSAAVRTLTANAFTEGSVDYKIAQAISKIMDDNDPADLDSIKELVDWINDHAADALELGNQVTANKNDVVTLKTLVGGTSVASQIHSAVESALRPDSTEKYALASDLADALTTLVTHSELLDTLCTTVESNRDAISGLIAEDLDTCQVTLTDDNTLQVQLSNSASSKTVTGNVKLPFEKAGNSIDHISGPDSTVGLVDTYTIHLTGGGTKKFTVTNGAKGDAFTYDDFTPEQLEELKGNIVEFATFHIDLSTGRLIMRTPDEAGDTQFYINNNGYLNVRI